MRSPCTPADFELQIGEREALEKEYPDLVSHFKTTVYDFYQKYRGLADKNLEKRVGAKSKKKTLLQHIAERELGCLLCLEFSKQINNNKLYPSQ